MLLTAITAPDLVPLLVARGLLSQRAAVEGTVAIAEQEGRTGGLTIDQGDAGSWFVKEGDSGGRGEAVAQEARVLEHLSGSPEMAARVPLLHSFDPETHLLVQHLVRGTCMRERAASGQVTAEAMADLASALAALHALAEGCDDLALGEADVKWALEMHRPRVGDLAWLSASALELLRALQGQFETCAHLDRLRGGWRAEALVHADLRWDNVMAVSGSGPEAIVLVDWESAGTGDTAWDVGCVLAQLISDWIVSMPVSRDPSATLVAGAAGRDLRSIHGQARVFWSVYVQHRSQQDAADLLGRSATYAGLRLLQFGIEIAQPRSKPTRGAVAHMQVGCNVLAEPWRAADVLLGLSP